MSTSSRVTRKWVLAVAVLAVGFGVFGLYRAFAPSTAANSGPSTANSGPPGVSASSAPPGAGAGSAPPAAAGYFSLQPAGSWSKLPSGSQCAAEVHYSSWEPRPENYQQNHTMPAAGAMAASFALRPRDRGGTYNARWDSWLLPRVDGRFTGTTDEILQWAACKWGLPDNLIRADAAIESSWFQYLHFPGDASAGGGGGSCYWKRGCGDAIAPSRPSTILYCNGIASEAVLPSEVHDYQKDPVTSTGGYPYIPGPGLCPKTFSILGIMSWNNPNWQPPHEAYPGNQNGTFPFTRDSTAAAADYWGAYMRGCYEGWETWLNNTGPRPYTAGDIWGCIGAWFSGQWHTEAADGYISRVRSAERELVWLNPSFDDSKEQYHCAARYGCPV